MESKEYYETRLSFILQMYKDGERSLLDSNQDKIKSLLFDYRKMSDYDKILASSVETFVINESL